MQPLAFFLFFTAAIAETKRIPFDVPEGESELVAGYFTEYSGMKFGMFFIGEYIEVVASSALLVGALPRRLRPAVPAARRPPTRVRRHVLWSPHVPHIVVVIIRVLAFIVKVVVLCWLQLMIRWTLPRFRYDQIMKLCWTLLLPLSLAQHLRHRRRASCFPVIERAELAWPS